MRGMLHLCYSQHDSWGNQSCDKKGHQAGCSPVIFQRGSALQVLFSRSLPGLCSLDLHRR